MSKNKILENYVKAYKKHKESEKNLDKAKQDALSYVKGVGGKIKYGCHNFIVCVTKSYLYTENIATLAKELHDKKKIEELDGSASVKSTSEYIRLNEVK